jgi:glucose 1-dehydrogenase
MRQIREANMKLQEKVAIVTGSATGIGRAIAERFGGEGALVVIDHTESSAGQAHEAVEGIRLAGGSARAVEADVTRPRDVDNLISETVKSFGRLDILVNNAGVEHKMAFLETPIAIWNEVIAVNLTGPWLCSQAAARQMVSQGGGGRIINISSVHEDLPMPANSPYCASKGGLRMLMRTIAVELAKQGITVNNIAPGAIETPMDAPIEENPELLRALLGEIPLGRMGKPEEVAEVACLLASDAGAYITGSTYVVDGGLLRFAGSL